jgi:hypothetical protein
MYKTILATAMLMSAAISQAAPLSYDYVEGGYGEWDRDDALFVTGSKALDNNLFILGSIYAIDNRLGDGFYLEGGVGYHLPLSKQVDLVMSAEVLYGDNGIIDDMGAILRAGVRFTPADRVELEGVLAVSSNDALIDDGIGLNATARYFFSNVLSGAIGLHSDTELDGVSLSMRYNFR